MNLTRTLRHAWQPALAAILTALLFGYLVVWYFWLAIPDSTGFYVALQPVLALAGISALAWTWAGLIGLLSARAQGEPTPLAVLWRPGRRAWLLALAMLTILALALFLVNRLGNACMGVVWKIPSWLTYQLNHRVPIPPFVRATHFAFAFLEWGVLPALATMMLTARLRGRGFWRGWRIAHPWRLVLFTAITLFALVWLPWLLAHWVPLFRRPVAELLSALVRIAAAWILATLGLLLLLALWTGAVEKHPVA